MDAGPDRPDFKRGKRIAKNVHWLTAGMQQIIVIIIARCVWAGTIGCINLYSLPFSLNLWTFLVLSILPRVIDCRVILCEGGDEVRVV